LQILSHVFTVSPDTELTPPDFALLLAGCGFGKGFWMGHLTALSECPHNPPVKWGKGSSYSITERSVPELIPILCSWPAGDVSHKPVVELSLLSARPAVTPATFNRAATNFSSW